MHSSASAHSIGVFPGPIALRVEWPKEALRSWTNRQCLGVRIWRTEGRIRRARLKSLRPGVTFGSRSALRRARFREQKGGPGADQGLAENQANWSALFW